jgi:hypothetical protein
LGLGESHGCALRVPRVSFRAPINSIVNADRLGGCGLCACPAGGWCREVYLLSLGEKSLIVFDPGMLSLDLSGFES